MGFRSSLLTAALLAALCSIAPVQAAGSIWDFLPATPGIEPKVIEFKGLSGSSPSCDPNDPICNVTCGQRVFFDDNYQDPQVSLQEKKIVVPGPGTYGQQIVLLGHWTICL